MIPKRQTNSRERENVIKKLLECNENVIIV
jgi:hypothetical protein